MSILNKLKNINTRQSTRLYTKHPLAAESLEFRLQYLAAVALTTALEREPNAHERAAFNGLSDSLAIDPNDGDEQLNERSHLSEEDIETLLASIRKKDVSYLYLLDTAWVHAADGTVDADEAALTTELLGVLGIKPQVVQDLHALAEAVHRKVLSQKLEVLARAWQYQHLHTQIKAIANLFFPFERVVDGQWIDHGNKTATSIINRITWMTGAPEFLCSKDMKFVFGIKMSGQYELESVDLKMKKLGIDGKEWRIPSQIELIEIKNFPSSLFDEDIPYEDVVAENVLNKHLESQSKQPSVYLIFCKQFNF
ncbi:hypothetical protein [Macromonas bipunctata]|uniref:hypothetical protein n=1 Tax=Macromonas bipunctata TaxID=183670 RepID=UPI000C32E05D|nr:hypothetical protein [Macromonas bipunctata]